MPKVTLILQEKFVKFELSHQKKVLDKCNSTLEFFLVKFFIFYFHQLNLFSKFTKYMKKFKIEKKVKNNFFVAVHFCF